MPAKGFRFPGGTVTYEKHSEGGGWLHINLDAHPDTLHNPIVYVEDSRFDCRDKHASECDPSDVDNPNLYHMAFLIRPNDEDA
jgi:hypothetical protein